VTAEDAAMTVTPQQPDPANPPAPEEQPAPPASAAETVSPNAVPPKEGEAEKPSADTLKAALKAFRKRLKVTTLDHNSRIGKSPMSGGSSQLMAITPPNDYPRAVWQALCDEGKLKYVGQGMYELRA
jgi:hypothetical protein